MDTHEVPPDNPFARPKAKAVTASAPPAEVQASAPPAPAPAAASPSARAPSSRRVVAEEEVVHAESVAVEDPTAGGEPEFERAPPSVHKRKACHGCRRCCVGCHRMVTRSRVATLTLALLAGLAATALFIYSCTQLPSVPSVGSGCGTLSCAGNGPVTTKTCMAFGVYDSSCDDVCGTPAAQAIAPFRFTVAGTPGYVFCTFPKKNTNWRIPTTVFVAVICAVMAPLAMRKRRAAIVMVSGVLTLVAGGIMFFVMIIDAAAVDAGQRACKAMFPTVYWSGIGWTPDCNPMPFVATCLADAGLALLLLYVGVVLIGASRSMRAAAKAAAAAAAAAPKRPTLPQEPTAAAKREMFSPPEEDGEPSAPRPAFE